MQYIYSLMCRISRWHPMMGQWILTSCLRCSGLAICVATASMGGLDSAAAAARLVADAYMAAPADVAAAPAATAVGPMSWMDLISRDMNLYGLLYGLVRTTCGCRWTILEFMCICAFLNNIKYLRCLFEIACYDNCDIYEMLLLFWGTIHIMYKKNI